MLHRFSFMLRRFFGLQSSVQPLLVTLEITGGDKRSIYAMPHNLPSLPQVGHTISVDVSHRGLEYTAVVEQVLFRFSIDAARGGECDCQDVVVMCRMLEQAPLVS